MANQSGKNLIIGYKVEATYNTAPGTGSGLQLRINPSSGLSLKRTEIVSQEVRSDGLSSMSRLGSRMVDGSYSVPMTVGGLDTIFQALLRSTWVAASTVTFNNGAALTSLTVDSSSQVTFTGTTTPNVAGLRHGDVFRLANMSTAANDNVNCRVKSISGSVVTLYGTPLTTQAADTACTLTIMRKLTNATTPTKRTFYIEEYNQDIDVSEVFGGCKFIALRLSGTPDGNVAAEISVLGASGAVLASGSSPYYISPTLNTAIELVFTDANIAYGSDVVTCTAFDLTYTITAKTEPIIGGTVSPDVFDNDARLTGSLSFVRTDLANVTSFLAETEAALHILLVEPDAADPKDCIAIYVPRIKLTAADAPLGGDGAMIETLPFTAGKSESVTNVNDTLLTISTSAA